MSDSFVIAVVILALIWIPAGIAIADIWWNQ